MQGWKHALLQSSRRLAPSARDSDALESCLSVPVVPEVLHAEVSWAAIWFLPRKEEMNTVLSWTPGSLGQRWRSAALGRVMYISTAWRTGSGPKEKWILGTCPSRYPASSPRSRRSCVCGWKGLGTSLCSLDWASSLRRRAQAVCLAPPSNSGENGVLTTKLDWFGR